MKFTYLLFLSTFFFCFTLLSAEAKDPFSKLSAKQIVVIDLQSGQILYERNAREKMPTSSMSKVMTMYMVFEALKNGEITLNDTLKVSEKAWRKGGSKMFIEVGKHIKVEDLIKGVIVQSGNDATIALAEGVSGSEDVFAQTMTKKAHLLGMQRSNFVNASGWPNPDHYSTAFDLAILASRIISDFPEYYKYYSMTEFEFNGIKQRNRNPLLFRDDLNVDGIKTGHTEVGGYGLMASGLGNGGRRVVLVMNGMDTNRARAQETARVMNWALNGFSNELLAKQGSVFRTIPIIYGSKASINAVLERDLLVTLPNSGKEEYKIEIESLEPIKAPIQKGQNIGMLRVIDSTGKVSVERPLLSDRDVQKSNFFFRMIQNFNYKVFGI